MMRSHFNILLAVALTGIALPGCKGAGPKQPYPNDPLLISKKPAEGKPASTKSLVVANRGPVPPSPWINGYSSGDERSIGAGALSEAPRSSTAANQAERLTSALQRELHE